MKNYFMKTERIGFSVWESTDFKLAEQLWGDPEVTRYLCATGVFTTEDIKNRLATEIRNYEQEHVQYWPLFELTTGELIGCCGLRPFTKEEDCLELGFYLCKHFWGKGLAKEAAEAVIQYAFETLKPKKIYVGHHPDNANSAKVLRKLGFTYIGKNYYEPTGLYHPSYEMDRI